MRLLQCVQLRSGSGLIGGALSRPYGFAGRVRAFTLLEVMVAGGIFTMAFAGLYAAANHVMNLIRRSESSAVAQRNCLARLDQLRSAAWANATTPAYIASLLSLPTGTAVFDSEVVSVYRATVPPTMPVGSSPSPAEGSALLFTVTKTGKNAPVISPANFDPETIIDSFQLNFRVRTGWQRVAKPGERELSTIISKSALR